MKSQIELKDVCPTTYNEAWSKYPKLRHLFLSTVLLDFQHIPWTPFKSNDNIRKNKLFSCSTNDSHVYTSQLPGDEIKTEVVICKGEIKRIEHYDKDFKMSEEINGSLELKIGAFVANSFNKMSCVIIVDSVNDAITGISLVPDFDYIDSKENETEIKAIKKLYNRREWS